MTILHTNIYVQYHAIFQLMEIVNAIMYADFCCEKSDFMYIIYETLVVVKIAVQ